MNPMPERIFAGHTFNGERDWTANGDTSGGYAAYTRTDMSEAAIATARAEGVREGMLKAAEIADQHRDPTGTEYGEGWDACASSISKEARADAGDAP